MSGYWTSVASFVDAHLGAGGAVCVALADDELATDQIAFTKVAVLYQGNWLDGGNLKWAAACVTRCQFPLAQYVVVGVNGQAQFVGGGDIHEEVIQDGVFAASDLGLLRGARAIDGVLYVCGMKRQVFRRDGRDQWRCLTAEISAQKGVVGFEAIDGFSEKEIYAVGWEGEIWQYDGTQWYRRNSGTNVILRDVVCAANGIVYAIGRERKLVFGRKEGWASIDIDLPTDLQSLAWFNNALYACSTRDVFIWDGAQFQPLFFAGDGPKTLQYLHVGEGGLCAVGPKDLFRFDGEIWSRID